MDAQLQDQLQELLDRKACEDVLMRYGRTLDWLDEAGQESCFWPDADIDYGFFQGSGKALPIYHAGLSDSDSDATTDNDCPGRNMHRKKAAVAFKKPAAKKSAMKKKSSKLTRRAKEQQYLAYESSGDEFAESK